MKLRDLLLTLRRSNNTVKFVPRSLQHKAIESIPGYRFAVCHGTNFRSVSLVSDGDAATFDSIGDIDPVAKRFARRARELIASPPAPGQDGITDSAEK